MKKKKTRAEVLAKARQVIGEYLRAIREHRGLSQTELADSVGLRQADISEVENGSLNYGVDKLLAYCRGVDCYFFLGSRDGKHLDLDHMARHTFMQQGLEAEVHDRALQRLMGIGDQAYKHYRGSFSTDDLDKAHERIRKRRR